MVSIEQIWSWLAEVPDPEIPVISVVDLGIVRDVRWDEDELVVRITPTYSGCPATRIIGFDIDAKLRGMGVERLRIEQQLAPPWTTDWLSHAGRRKLHEYGIAAPAEKSGARPRIDRYLRDAVTIACPRCGSTATTKISEFGSTPCKAQYRCESCREPFDYFKCI